MFLLKKVFPKMVWNIPTTEKILFLTFDDGPHPEITPWVLDALKQYNAKATFFCVGENVKRNPVIYQRILMEGHSTGNHTHSHLKGWVTMNKKYFDDVAECSKHIHSKLFRPPYGKIKPSQARTLHKNYRIIMWDVLSCDYDENISAEKCFQNVESKGKEGSIIVFHDSEKALPRLKYVLPKTLEKFTAEGFQFGRIDE